MCYQYEYSYKLHHIYIIYMYMINQSLSYQDGCLVCLQLKKEQNSLLFGRRLCVAVRPEAMAPLAPP